MALRLKLTDVGSYYPERASALHFKDAATPRVGHMIADVVNNLFIETQYFALNRPLTQFFNTFYSFYV